MKPSVTITIVIAAAITIIAITALFKFQSVNVKHSVEVDVIGRQWLNTGTDSNKPNNSQKDIDKEK
ncbi:MAG: hypothetical protein WC196_02930 [Bacilli bacterium]|jgi:hypothetical protein